MPDAPTLLSHAKATIDAAPSLHFTLTSDGATGSGTILTGAEGDAKRPDSFSGVLHVSAFGAPLQVSIVSTQGTFYAELPFSSSFKKENPANYGFGDPAQLLNPDHGLSSLLALAKNPQLGDRTRFQGEELQEIRCTLPGKRVGELLTSVDPARDVQAVFRIDPVNNETRQVELTGPFTAKDHDTTYHLVLAKYGENVMVTAPST